MPLFAQKVAGGVWIDVRSFQEHQRKSLPGHLHIPYDMIAEGVKEYKLDFETPIHLYCAVGGRAEYAKETLLKMGFKRVTNEGGINLVEEKLKNLPNLQ